MFHISHFHRSSTTAIGYRSIEDQGEELILNHYREKMMYPDKFWILKTVIQAELLLLRKRGMILDYTNPGVLNCLKLLLYQKYMN